MGVRARDETYAFEAKLSPEPGAPSLFIHMKTEKWDEIDDAVTAIVEELVKMKKS